MKNGLAASVCMSLSLVMLIIVLFGPWYSMSVSGAFGMNYHVDFFLTRMDIQGVVAGQNLFLSLPYNEVKEQALDIVVNTESFSLIENAWYLTVLALLSAGAGLICIAAFLLRKNNKKILKLIGSGFGAFTFILGIGISLYFMNIGLTNNNTEFWFRQEILGAVISGGPEHGWYLMMTAAVVAFFSCVLLLFERPGEKRI